MLKVSLILGRFEELPGGEQRQALEFARLADEAGLYGLTIGEHLVLGNRLDRYPYGTGFRHPEGSLTHYLEPAVTLGAFAAVTRQIRLSTCILLAPLRPAVLLAKQIATIDVLSNGRCEPSFGYGWQPEEYAAANVDWALRRQILRDNIAACRALWGPQPVSFRSPTVSFDELTAMPRPIQPRIPILLGVKPTATNAALIAELCDGWDPVSTYTPGELRDGTDRLRAAFESVGRDPDDLIIRPHILAARTDDGRIDVARSFAPVETLLDSGGNQIAFQIPAGYGTTIDSMAGIGDLVGEIAEVAKRF